MSSKSETFKEVRQALRNECLPFSGFSFSFSLNWWELWSKEDTRYMTPPGKSCKHLHVLNSFGLFPISLTFLSKMRKNRFSPTNFGFENNLLRKSSMKVKLLVKEINNLVVKKRKNDISGDDRETLSRCCAFQWAAGGDVTCPFLFLPGPIESLCRFYFLNKKIHRQVSIIRRFSNSAEYCWPMYSHRKWFHEF